VTDTVRAYAAPGRPGPPDAQRARVALIVGEVEQPAWVVRLAQKLVGDPGLELSVVVDPRAAGGDGGRGAAGSGLSRLMYSAFARYDDRRIPGNSDPRRPDDLRRVTDAGRIVDGPGAPSDFAVGVYLAGGKPGADLRARFERGVVSVHHGRVGDGEHGAPGVREVLDGTAEIHCTLLLWTPESDAPAVLLVSCVRTDRMSVAETAAHYYRNLTHLLASRVAAIIQECAVPATAAPSVSEGERWRDGPPGNFRTAAALGRMGALRIRRAVGARFEQEDWALAVARIDERLTPLDFDPRRPGWRPTLLLPPPGRIWADPFPIRRDGQLFVFFEEMARSTSVGHISLLELTERGGPRSVGPVLTAPYHLSYPFLFEWKGALFMLPETEENRTVEVYRCVSWPDSWTLEAVLLEDVSAADTTLVEAAGRWWMFTTMNPERDVDWDTNLYLFHASGPLGPWRPHRCNPVKSDVRSARSGGRLFWQGSRLIRPAQDCAERYGHALAFNEVVRLDVGGFQERVVGRMSPWGRRMVGMHTVNQDEDVLLLDCRVRRGKHD
jgi:hypothetical protein